MNLPAYPHSMPTWSGVPRLISIEVLKQTQQFHACDAFVPISPEDLARHRPDAHWIVAEGTRLLAQCSLWWTSTPRHGSERLGFIGHYGASDTESAGMLLRHACEQLAKRGCSRALAPLDGSTWRNYRFVTYRGDEPPFLFEPSHPSGWLDHFLAEGFTPAARYFSALNADLTYEDPALARVARRLSNRGITVRPMNANRFDAELQSVLAIARAAFRHHLLYGDIDETEFVQQYQRMRGVTGVELTMIAELEGQPVGFAFAAPDLLQQQRGAAVDTMIVKTLGVLPRGDLGGLGQMLLASVHRRGQQLGYRRAIYALVYDSPPLRRLSDRYARRIREYALFGKALPT